MLASARPHRLPRSACRVGQHPDTESCQCGRPSPMPLMFQFTRRLRPPDSGLSLGVPMRRLACLLTAFACGLPLFVCSALAQGYSPEEAVQRMQVPAGFEVQLVAAEPLVRQPVCIEFDDRGRLWVIQYLQYPNPEGLKRTAGDRFSRTK